MINVRVLLLWTVPLVLLAFALGTVTRWGEAVWAVGEPTWKTPKMTSSSTGVVPDVGFSQDASAFGNVTERNIFVPWRKAQPPVEPQKPAAEVARPQIRRGIYSLIGTFDPGNGIVGVVREVAGGRTRQVRMGEALQEYQVVKLEMDRIELAFAGQIEELALARFTASNRATQLPVGGNQNVALPPTSPQNPALPNQPPIAQVPVTAPIANVGNQPVAMLPQPSQPVNPQPVPLVPTAQPQRATNVAVENGQFVYRPR